MSEDEGAEAFTRWWLSGPAGRGYSRIKCARLAWLAALSSTARRTASPGAPEPDDKTAVRGASTKP